MTEILVENNFKEYSPNHSYWNYHARTCEAKKTYYSLLCLRILGGSTLISIAVREINSLNIY